MGTGLYNLLDQIISTTMSRYILLHNKCFISLTITNSNLSFITAFVVFWWTVKKPTNLSN